MADRAAPLAKLSRPRLYDALPRERLFRRLDAARRHPVIWIAAPPGAGKTTLVASYLESRKLPGIWYQVDSSDADPATFFYYLGLAAKSLGSRRHAKQPPLPLLTPEYLPNLYEFSQRYFRDLFSRFGRPAVLALDNFHEVAEGSGFHQVVHDVLAEIPEGTTIVVISRSDPPAAFSRELATQAIITLGWEDLRLTLDEAHDIAQAISAVDAARLQSLYAQSDGWAAGLVLMLERGSGQQPGSQSMSAESREAIFDFFATQFFDQAAPANQATLIATALFPTVTASLAAEISGNSEAGMLLEFLYRRHLFTNRVDGAEPSYQYHALFREFLLRRLHQSETPDALRALKLHAGALLTQRGAPEDALRLSVECEEWQQVASIILREAPRLLAQGRWQTLQKWIESVPAEVLTVNAWLQYWQGCARMQIDLVGARDIHTRAFRAFEEVRDSLGQLLCAAAILNGYYYEYDDFAPMDPWIDAVDRLLADSAKFPDSASELMVHSALLLALTFRQPGHALLPTCVDHVTRMLDAQINVNQRVAAAIALLTYFSFAGEFALGKSLISRIEPLTSAPELTALNQAYWSLFVGYHYHLLAEKALAESAFEMSDRVAHENGLSQTAFVSRCFRAYHFSNWYDVPNTKAAIQEAARLRNPARKMDTAQYHLINNALANVTLDGETAGYHAQLGLTAASTVGSPFFRVLWLVCGAPSLVLKGCIDLAEQWLADAWRESEGTYLVAYRATILFARAYIAFRRDDRVRFYGALREALALGRVTETDVFFRFHLHFMDEMFAEALRAGIDIPYVQELVRKFGVPPPGERIEAWPWPVKIYTLGGFELELDGKTAVFSAKAPRKTLALLKALICLGGRDVPDYQLIDALWPEEEGDAARTAFGVAIHRLRKLLGRNEAIELKESHVRLNPDIVWVDAFAFERLASEGLGESNGEANASVGRALSLYKGSLLPGDSEAPWSTAMREHLRAKFIHHVGQAGAQLEHDQQWQQAIELYLRGLDADSLTESFYQGLMRCHQSMGRRAEALSVYRRMRQTLSVTLGIKPSPESEALHASLVGSS
jgi:DNA-binding SARP family transcriptional activator